MTSPRVEPLYLTWLNYLGGFEYFLFLAKKEFMIDITQSQTTKQNVFPNWPQSWGQTADTVEKKTFTEGYDKIIVPSQYITPNQRDGLSFIKLSPVVQVVLSRNDRETWIVDQESFKLYNESDKLTSIQFTLRRTAQKPAQRL